MDHELDHELTDEVVAGEATALMMARHVRAHLLAAGQLAQAMGALDTRPFIDEPLHDVQTTVGQATEATADLESALEGA